jgi:hypothetical protein
MEFKPKITAFGIIGKQGTPMTRSQVNTPAKNKITLELCEPSTFSYLQTSVILPSRLNGIVRANP